MAMILKTAAPARGAMWVRDGLRLYMRRPLAFTGLFAIFMVAALLVTWLPLVGGVVQIMMLPMLTLGFMVASQSALLDGPVQPSQFIEPLRGDARQRRQLLVLCVAYGLVMVGVLVAADEIADGGLHRVVQLMWQPNRPQAEIDALLASREVSAGVLFATVALALLAVPFWHAPALVHWGGQSAAQSLFSSTLAVWRNRGAFLVYMLSWFGLMLGFVFVGGLVFGLLGLGQVFALAVLPAGLFFSTLFYVSLVFGFNDSFGLQ